MALAIEMIAVSEALALGKKLGIDRKVLTGLVDALGMIDKFTSFAIALDKLDKVGWDSVKNELLDQGFEIDKLNKLKVILEFEGTNEQMEEGE